MFRRHFLLIIFLTFLLTAADAKADTPSCTSTDCTALGYTMTVSDCSGAETLKCPFDTSKVICLPVLDTPVFNFVQKMVKDNAIGSFSQPLALRTPLDPMFNDDWIAYSYKVCRAIDGNYDLECNEADFEEFTTVGDIVTWVENKLMGETTPTDPCEGYVTVDDDTEVCTSYCSTDSSKCMTKRAITCSEAIAKQGGVALPDGRISDYASHYLTKDTTLGNISDLAGSRFYEASVLPACAKDSSVTQHPTLEINTINGISQATFEVDTKIRTMYVERGDSPDIIVSRNFQVMTMDIYTSAMYPAEVNIRLYDHPDNADYSVTTGLECEDMDGYGNNSCSVTFDGNSLYQAIVPVTWCNNPESYGTGTNNVQCTGGGNNTCSRANDDYTDCRF